MKNVSFERGVEFAIQKAEELATPDDWGVPSVYPSVLRQELGHDDPEWVLEPLTVQCKECFEHFLPTIETYAGTCNDCHRRLYQ